MPSSRLFALVSAVAVLAGCVPAPANPSRPALVGATLESVRRRVEIGPGFAGWIELELSRTRQEVIHDLPAPVADVHLVMRYDDGTEFRYELLSGGRLHDVDRGETRRFYMALLLREAHDEGRAPEAAPPVAAEPAAPSSATTVEEPVEAVVQAVGSDAKLSLGADDRRALARELARTRPYATPGSPTDGLRVAPDWTLTVRYADGREQRYACYGRSALHDQAADRTTQFYMGLYLSQKLHETSSDGRG